jgi:hypothetical protein
MKTLTLFCLLLCSLHCAIAQEDVPLNDESDNWKYGIWFEANPLTSFAFYSSPNMAKFIEQSGNDFSQFFQYASVHSGVRLRNTSLRVDVGISLSNNDDPVNHYFTFAGLSLEQSIVKSPRYRVNIGAGYGGYVQRLEVSQQEPGRVIDFSNALNERFRQVGFLNEGGAFNFSIGISDRERRMRSVGFAYRLGYQMGRKPQVWEGVSAQFNNAPKDRFGLLYFEGNILLSRNFKKR